MEKQAKKKLHAWKGGESCDIVGTLEPINYNSATRRALCFLTFILSFNWKSNNPFACRGKCAELEIILKRDL